MTPDVKNCSIAARGTSCTLTYTPVCAFSNGAAQAFKNRSTEPEPTCQSSHTHTRTTPAQVSYFSRTFSDSFSSSETCTAVTSAESERA